MCFTQQKRFSIIYFFTHLSILFPFYLKYLLIFLFTFLHKVWFYYYNFVYLLLYLKSNFLLFLSFCLNKINFYYFYLLYIRYDNMIITDNVFILLFYYYCLWIVLYLISYLNRYFIILTWCKFLLHQQRNTKQRIKVFYLALGGICFKP